MKDPRQSFVTAAEFVAQGSPDWYRPGPSDLSDAPEDLCAVNVAIPKKIRERLFKFSKQNGVKVKWVVAHAVHEYLQARESGRVKQLKSVEEKEPLEDYLARKEREAAEA